jgi:hypothetical protein
MRPTHYALSPDESAQPVTFSIVLLDYPCGSTEPRRYYSDGGGDADHAAAQVGDQFIWTSHIMDAGPPSCSLATQAYEPTSVPSFHAEMLLWPLIVTGGGQSAEVGSEFPDEIVLKLVDAAGNPLAGKHLSLSDNIQDFEPNTGVTDSEGILRIRATAGNDTGSYQTSVYSTDYPSPPTYYSVGFFTLTNTAPPD